MQIAIGILLAYLGGAIFTYSIMGGYNEHGPGYEAGPEKFIYFLAATIWPIMLPVYLYYRSKDV